MKKDFLFLFFRYLFPHVLQLLLIQRRHLFLYRKLTEYIQNEQRGRMLLLGHINCEQRHSLTSDQGKYIIPDKDQSPPSPSPQSGSGNLGM